MRKMQRATAAAFIYATKLCAWIALWRANQKTGCYEAHRSHELSGVSVRSSARWLEQLAAGHQRNAKSEATLLREVAWKAAICLWRTPNAKHPGLPHGWQATGV